MNFSLPLSPCITRRLTGAACLVTLAGVLLLGGVSTARADSIGVNFIGGGGDNTTLVAGTSAGVVAQTNFNNLSAASGTSGMLNNNNGVATAATVTYTAQNIAIFRNSPAGGDEQFNNGIILSGQGFAITFSLNNIPYNTYDLYVYDLNFNGITQQATLGATSFFGSAPNDGTSAGYVDGNAATPFTYTQATSTTMASPSANANYVRFSGLSGRNQTFSVTGLDGVGVVQGFQVVATPEPNTYAMMALGMGALGLLAWKRKRGETSDSREFAEAAI